MRLTLTAVLATLATLTLAPSATAHTAAVASPHTSTSPHLTYRQANEAVYQVDKFDHPTYTTLTRCFRRTSTSVQCWEDEHHVRACNVGYEGCHYYDASEWVRVTYYPQRRFHYTNHTWSHYKMWFSLLT